MDRAALPGEEEKNNNVSAYFFLHVGQWVLQEDKRRRSGTERSPRWFIFVHHQSRCDKWMMSNDEAKEVATDRDERDIMADYIAQSHILQPNYPK